MIKKLVIILGCLIMIGCSTGESRINKVKNIGEVIYQKNPKEPDIDDTFIIKNRDNEFLIVYISAGMSIYKIDKIGKGYMCLENIKK